MNFRRFLHGQPSRLGFAVVLAATLPALLGPAGRCQLPTPQDSDRSVRRSTPLITGVQLHFGGKIHEGGYQPGPSIAAMRTLNAVSVRDNISWPDLASVPGALVSARLPALYQLTHLRDAAPPLLTPNGIIPAVDGGGLPRSPQGMHAFAAFVGSAATAWRGSHALIEIWNEWDKGAKRGDASGTPQSYAALVKASAPAVRRALPDATILAGGAADDAGGLRFAWTKAMIDAGGLNAADALSVHLYDHCGPDLLPRATDEMMGRLDGLHAYAVARAPDKADIYVSEFGWPTDGSRCAVDGQAVAENVAQFIFAAAARPWIRGVWYYELKDSGRDPSSVESHFGLMTYDYRPKPAFCAYRAAAGIVRSSRPVRIVRTGGATRVDFTGRGGMTSIVWLTDRTRPVQFQTDAATAQPLCEAAVTAKPGWATLTALPIILKSSTGAAAPRIAFRAG